MHEGFSAQILSHNLFVCLCADEYNILLGLCISSKWHCPYKIGQVGEFGRREEGGGRRGKHSHKSACRSTASGQTKCLTELVRS